MLPEDILAEFIHESKTLLNELTEVVEKIENDHPAFPSDLLTIYAQRIDRILGAAKTIGLMEPDNPSLKAIGAIAEICKRMGYKAAEKKDLRLLPFFAAFWAEAIENIETLLNCIHDTKKAQTLVSSISNILQGRLRWLEGKLNSCS